MTTSRREQTLRNIHHRYETRYRDCGALQYLLDIGWLLRYLTPILAENLELKGTKPVVSYWEWVKAWEEEDKREQVQ